MPASDDLPSYQFTPVCQRVHPEQRANVKYELILRQQPKQSRMCGVGEKADRRPIDPPPIVQLIVKTPPSSGGSKTNNGFTSYLQNPYYFMHASLVEKDTREDVLLIKDTRSKEDMHFFKDNRTKATTGSSVSSLYPLKDFEDNGTESGFFVFPDLSVRMEGTYRLKFCLYEMVGKDVHFCAHVISDPLIVYSAKKFPGMEESTILSQYFAEQGLKIRIRKEVRPKKRSRGNYVMYGPTSQSPTGSQHQDQGDGTESQDEEETSTTAETSIASKRRASGTRSIEPKRGEAPLTPQSDTLKHGEQDSRPALGQRGGSWRGPATEYAEKPPPSSAVDRPRSAHGAYPNKQQGHFDDPAFAGGRASAANRAANRAAEGVSHLDLNAGTRPDQRVDEYRPRIQDQGPVGRERGGFAGSPATWLGTAASQHPRGGGMARSPPMPVSHSAGRSLGPYAPESPTASSFRSSSMAHGDGPGARPGLYSVHESMDVYEPAIRSEPAYTRPQSAVLPEYADNPRRGSGGRPSRETGGDSAFTYSARGALDSQRHLREAPHSAPYSVDDRLRTAQHQAFGLGPKSSEPGYPYVARPDYSSPPEQRPMDFVSAAPYAPDHHRSSISSHPYDRTEHQPRPSAAPAGQPGPAFPPPSLQASYPQRSPREQQHQDQSSYMHTDVQDQSPSTHRSYPHTELYSGHGHSLAPPPRPSNYAPYPTSDGHASTSVYAHSPPGPHALPDQELGVSGKYHSGYAAQEGVGPGSGRHISHGPPSYKSGVLEVAERQTREGLGAAAARTGPLPVSPPRLQDYSAQPRHSISHRSESISGSGSAGLGTFRYGYDERSPSSGYGEHHRELESDKSRRPSAQASSGLGSYGAGPGLGPRSASVVEQHYENRVPYGHGRSHSSSSISRVPYVPSSSAPAPLPKRASYSQAGEGMVGQGRAPGPYEGYDSGRGTHTPTTHVPGHSSGQSGYDGHSNGGRLHESEHEYAASLGPVHAHSQGPPAPAPYYHGQPQSRPSAIVQPYYNQGQHYAEQHAPQAVQTQHPQHPQHSQHSQHPQHHYMLQQQQQQQAPSQATHAQQYHTYAQQQYLQSAQPPPAGPHGHGYEATAAAQGEDASKRSRI